MSYKDLPTGKNPPDEVNLLVEIPAGDSVKYEFDKKSGYLMVDRLVASPVMSYPGNYGFFPQTLGEDGDPLDAFTWNTAKLYPGTVIAVRPVAVLIMEDDKGFDHKVLVVPVHSVSTRFDDIKDLEDIPEKEREPLEYFFTHYKDLARDEGKWSKTHGWKGAAEARRIIQEAIDRAQNTPAPAPGVKPQFPQM